MPLLPFGTHKPKVHESLFLAPDAWVTGQVSLAEDVSIFFGSVLRGDVQAIRVGKGTNIQEHAMLHTSHGLSDCIVGQYVTIGHHAIIHGCSIGDNCIIGMGSTILDGAEIGANSIVGANSLVTMNKKFPSRSMIMGSPAKVIRELTDEEVASIKDSAESYIKVGQTYREHFLTIP